MQTLYQGTQSLSDQYIISQSSWYYSLEIKLDEYTGPDMNSWDFHETKLLKEQWKIVSKHPPEIMQSVLS